MLGSLGITAMALGQMSDLRYSRIAPPELSDMSQIGITVEIATGRQPPDSTLVWNTVKSRMENLGYTVVFPSPQTAEDLMLQVHCRDAPDSLDTRYASVYLPNTIPKTSPSAIPPCRVSYLYKGETQPWINVDRFIYAEGISAMNRIAQTRPDLTPHESIHAFLRQYDFPILLAAEWGHVTRLIQTLNHRETSLSRQRLIIELLGEIQDSSGYPVLIEKLQDASLAGETATALGFFGLRARPSLLAVLQAAHDPALAVAAAKGLGRIAAMTGDSGPTPLFLEMISDPAVDIRVKTELVWALGKAPDSRALPTLSELEQTIWLMYSKDPHLQKLREAVEWSIREVKQGGHTGDY